MCRGYAYCGDKSDIRACNPELTCVSGSGSNVSTIHSDLADGHSFCIQSNDRNDGTYDAVTREDEDNLDIVSTSAVSLDYSKLGHCNDSNGNPGVMCGSRCMPSPGWCNAGVLDQCDDGVHHQQSQIVPQLHILAGGLLHPVLHQWSYCCKGAEVQQSASTVYMPMVSQQQLLL